MLNGKKISKSCPKCGKKLVIRQNKKTKQHFIGCPEWPKCTHTEKLPEEFRMEAQGAKRMF